MSEDDLSILRALVLAYAGGDWWVREPLLALLNALLEAERASGSGGYPLLIPEVGQDDLGGAFGGDFLTRGQGRV